MQERYKEEHGSWDRLRGRTVKTVPVHDSPEAGHLVIEIAVWFERLTFPARVNAPSGKDL
jgi:hypothetical protein